MLYEITRRAECGKLYSLNVQIPEVPGGNRNTGAENIVLASLTQKVPLLCFEWAAEWRGKNKECLAWLVSLGFTKFHVQMEDKYDYVPATIDKTVNEIMGFFETARDKVDWGMIWAQ